MYSAGASLASSVCLRGLRRHCRMPGDSEPSPADCLSHRLVCVACVLGCCHPCPSPSPSPLTGRSLSHSKPTSTTERLRRSMLCRSAAVVPTTPAWRRHLPAGHSSRHVRSRRAGLCVRGAGWGSHALCDVTNTCAGESRCQVAGMIDRHGRG